MRERPEQILRFVCWGLGALVLFQVVRIILHANPLAHVVIPALPALVETTPVGGQPANMTREPKRRPPIRRAKEISARAGVETSAPAALSTPGSTNSVAEKSMLAGETNLTLTMTTPATARAVAQGKTNSDLRHGSASVSPASSQDHQHKTGLLDAGAPGAARHVLTGTNPQSNHPFAELPVALGNVMTFRSASKQPPLPPAIQASVDRITDSEILGPVIHPLPMALLGIAGDIVFLRAPDGQTGLVKTGDELGGIKLLRIGTNRVLIEQAGLKKELTIFGGMGGQSLLNKPSEPSHETNTH